MRYANLFFDGNRTTSVNIGDDLQLIAIQNIYKTMGINENDIVKIGFSQLSTYDGEYVILPVSFPLYGYREGLNITMFSPKIIPVFLGLSIMSDNLSDEEIRYLQRFEPIGCRDYYTMEILRSKNIMCYMGGCATALLPRVDERKGEKIYIIDVPKKMQECIPGDIRDNAIYMTQVLMNCNNPEQVAKERLQELADNARMVITTRLHSALPCVAMGIPVVLMKDYFSFRFTTISKFLHVYVKEEFDNINWNPKSVCYEETKKLILNYDIKRIEETYNKYNDMLSISELYEVAPQPKEVYVEHFHNVIDDVREQLENGKINKYAIWGITQKADMVCSHLEKNYPNTQLVAVYDRNKSIEFHGIKSTSYIEAICEKDVYVFVTAATANAYAKELFNKIDKFNYHISTDGIGE